MVLTLLAGGPLQGLDRVFRVFVLPASVWMSALIAGIGVAGVVALILRRQQGMSLGVSGALAGLAFAVTSLTVGALRAEQVRAHALEARGLSLEWTPSTLQSFGQDYGEFQFFTHGWAIVDCEAFAWSWRELDLYRLKESVARNVVPVPTSCKPEAD